MIVVQIDGGGSAMTLVDVGLAEMATEQLEAETCTLAAQIAAASCRFLMLISELERREAWRSWGCRSLAHWLSWQCGLGLVAARDHVRAATALREMPQVRDAFGRGELSYSKVRALTRVTGMTEHAERELLDFAKIATAAQVDRTVAAYRMVERNEKQPREEPELRDAYVRTNDDGTAMLVVPLAADEVVEVRAALDAARKELCDTNDPAGASLRSAVLHLARTYREPDRHQQPVNAIVVHSDANVTLGIDAAHGKAIGIEALRRIACDSVVRHINAKSEHDAGRARRTVNRAQRRALARRDGDQCRFPGCSHRHYLQAHHVKHWADGGGTDLANLVLLCPFHHRLVHDGGWRIIGDANGPLDFVGPSGKRVQEEASRQAIRAHWRTVPIRKRKIHGTAIRTAHGEPMDLNWTVTALCCLVPPDGSRQRSRGSVERKVT
jgi:hypothetical protein